MTAYHTANREYLLRFLKANSNTALTVQEMLYQIQHEHTDGKTPATSSIYRLIKKFVNEGIVIKMIDTHRREFVYQFAKEKDSSHMYMRCKVCGKLCPMNLHDSERLVQEIQNTKSFRIDHDIVLNGICKSCQ